MTRHEYGVILVCLGLAWLALDHPVRRHWHIWRAHRRMVKAFRKQYGPWGPPSKGPIVVRNPRPRGRI